MDFDLSIYLPKGGLHRWLEIIFYVTSSTILKVLDGHPGKYDPSLTAKRTLP